jgi:hypothetical protein
MKKLTILSALLVLVMFKFSGCDSDDNKPNAEKKYMERLSFTWNLQQVKVGGVDVTPAFIGLVLTVKGDKTFTVTKAIDPIWPGSGTFTLREVPGSGDYDILRNDGIEMIVTELSPVELKIQLQYQPAGGRISSVGGQYEFLFTR